MRLCPGRVPSKRQQLRRLRAAAASGAKLLTPEQKSKHTRPAGWVAPGPPPAGPQGQPDLEPAADSDLSFLTGDWRIFQLKDGHR
jgi:hypothetical protein